MPFVHFPRLALQLAGCLAQYSELTIVATALTWLCRPSHLCPLIRHQVAGKQCQCVPVSPKYIGIVPRRVGGSFACFSDPVIGGCPPTGVADHRICVQRSVRFGRKCTFLAPPPITLPPPPLPFPLLPPPHILSPPSRPYRTYCTLHGRICVAKLWEDCASAPLRSSRTHKIMHSVASYTCTLTCEATQKHKSILRMVAERGPLILK